MSSKTFLIGLFLFVGYWMVHLYAPFLENIIIASLLAIATNNLYQFFEFKCKHRVVAALTITFLLAVLFLVPLGYLVSSLALVVSGIDKEMVLGLADQFKVWIEKIPPEYMFIKTKLSELSEKLYNPELISEVFSSLASVGKLSAGFVSDMVMILLFYFFMQYYGRAIVLYIRDVLPLGKQQATILFEDVTNTMGVVFYSIIVTAVFEGVLFGLATWYLGMDGFLLGILYGIASLIPVVGGTLMWLPVAIYQLVLGETAMAIFIAVYSIVVISIIADTIIKPMIISYINNSVVTKKSEINEMLIFFSIIAGLSTFGFWGMIIGPALTSLFISVLLLFRHLKKIDIENSRNKEHTKR